MHASVSLITNSFYFTVTHVLVYSSQDYIRPSFARSRNLELRKDKLVGDFLKLVSSPKGKGKGKWKARESGKTYATLKGHPLGREETVRISLETLTKKNIYIEIIITK
mmetsp:Transcript_14200/g.20646  ORF Transcript_14200/g.20646 Transcript_14200/m.20646 type:complete len:108 (-) Transcript_14200:1021-1344(-)